MAVLIDGNHLNQYVSPALVLDIRNTEDNFTKFLGAVNKGAVTAEGISINKLMNSIGVQTGVTETDTVNKRRLLGKKGVIPWQSFTTDALEFTHEELRAIAFDKEGEGRKLLKDAVTNAVLLHTLHAIAPDSITPGTPVVDTTGDDDGTGRKMLAPKDIITFLRKSDIIDPVGVLCKNHLLDLQAHAESSKRFEDILINQNTLTPKAYGGVNFVANDIKVRYTPAGAKRAISAAPAATDRFATVFIDKANTMFYLNNMMFITTEMTNDMQNAIPRSSVRIYGQFIGCTIEDDRRRGVIIDKLI